MRLKFNSNSLALIASVVLVVMFGCQTSTSHSKTQPATNILASDKAGPGSNRADANSEERVHVQQEIKLLPVDEAKNDPSFQRFRSDLLAAVKSHDADFVLGALHPAVENGYDIEKGVDEFTKRWKPSDPEGSVWDVLSSILTGGGSFSERDGHKEFCGPYVVSQWSKIVQQLPKGSDSLDYVVITGKDVAVRREPKLTAPIVATLSYDVVKSVPNSQVLDRSTAEFSSWIKITTPNGHEGFVPDSYVQGPMDYGACFRRTSGKWVISELAARH
jgi:hypothetical protein